MNRILAYLVVLGVACSSLAGNLPPKVVLCLNDTGHVALEFAADGKCCAPLQDGASPFAVSDKRLGAGPQAHECDPCADIPMPSIQTAALSFKSSPAAPVVSPVGRGNAEETINREKPVRADEHRTPVWPDPTRASLRTVILLI